jgi:hypothetical protein
MLFYLGFFVKRVLPVELAVLVEFKLFLQILAILGSGIILSLALGALKRDQLNSGFLGSHFVSPK